MQTTENHKPSFETKNNNIMPTTEKLNKQEKPKSELDFTCIMLDKRGNQQTSKSSIIYNTQGGKK